MMGNPIHSNIYSMQHESTNICKPTESNKSTNYYDPNCTKYYDPNFTNHDNSWWSISLWHRTNRKPQLSHIYFLFCAADVYLIWPLGFTSCRKLHLDQNKAQSLSDTLEVTQSSRSFCETSRRQSQQCYNYHPSSRSPLNLRLPYANVSP